MRRTYGLLILVIAIASLQDGHGFQVSSGFRGAKLKAVHSRSKDLGASPLALLPSSNVVSNAFTSIVSSVKSIRSDITPGLTKIAQWKGIDYLRKPCVALFKRMIDGVTNIVSPGSSSIAAPFVNVLDGTIDYVMKLLFVQIVSMGILSWLSQLIPVSPQVAPVIETVLRSFAHARFFELLFANFMPGEDNRVKYLLQRAGSVVVWSTEAVLLCFLLSSAFKLPLKTVFALGGVWSVFLGLMSKDLAANVLGGLQLLWNEPFTPGEIVTFKAGGTDILGKVEHVGWTQTRFRDRETRTTYIPNSIVANSLVTNLDRISHRKFESVLSLRFEDFARIPSVVAAIKKRLLSLPKLDSASMPLRVNFLRVTRNSLDIEVFCYFSTKSLDEFMSLQQAANLEIVKAVGESGASLALPSSVIHFDDRDAVTTSEVVAAGKPAATPSKRTRSTSSGIAATSGGLKKK